MAVVQEKTGMPGEIVNINAMRRVIDANNKCRKKGNHVQKIAQELQMTYQEGLMAAFRTVQATWDIALKLVT